jgi:hypothetical protein
MSFILSRNDLLLMRSHQAGNCPMDNLEKYRCKRSKIDPILPVSDQSLEQNRLMRVSQFAQIVIESNINNLDRLRSRTTVIYSKNNT